MYGEFATRSGDQGRKEYNLGFLCNTDHMMNLCIYISIDFHGARLDCIQLYLF
jgi:hypothetical protein